MRRASRPFVVEVKRGTKRSFFSDIKLDQLPPQKQEPKAIARLFSPAVPNAIDSHWVEPAERSGRVLRDLAEPEPSITAEPEPSIVRRGRKPGSKNKPKSNLAETDTQPNYHEVSAETWAMVRAATAAEPLPSPRAPAHHAAAVNRPAVNPVASPPARTPAAPARSVPRSAPLPRQRPQAAPAEKPSLPPQPPTLPQTSEPAPRPVFDGSTRAEPRARLRARSVILKRYVLGTEPLPGERWRDKSRRKG